MDLLDIGWFPLIRETYDSFVSSYRKTDIPLPRQNPQRSKAHRLDCAFFNYLVGEIIESQGEKVGAIRAVFNEGDKPTAWLRYAFTLIQLFLTALTFKLRYVT